ncbi:hypothetical protein GGR57DRAFT_484540 [Xylariaceae sp. FL1272]|nr:hypothetical protein GGR57DRAFT_484540 [Xylariaceae sp. FL1272]
MALAALVLTLPVHGTSLPMPQPTPGHWLLTITYLDHLFTITTTAQHTKLATVCIGTRSWKFIIYALSSNVIQLSCSQKSHSDLTRTSSYLNFRRECLHVDLKMTSTQEQEAQPPATSKCPSPLPHPSSPFGWQF